MATVRWAPGGNRGPGGWRRNAVRRFRYCARFPTPWRGSLEGACRQGSSQDARFDRLAIEKARYGPVVAARPVGWSGARSGAGSGGLSGHHDRRRSGAPTRSAVAGRAVGLELVAAKPMGARTLRSPVGRWSSKPRRGRPSQALWNAPATGLLPVPEIGCRPSRLAAWRIRGSTGIADRSRAAAVAAGCQRLMQSDPIEVAQREPGDLSQSQDAAPDTGVQAGESVPSTPNAPAAPAKSSDDKKLGKAPVDYSRQFLRTQSVLLKQGQMPVRYRRGLRHRRNQLSHHRRRQPDPRAASPAIGLRPVADSLRADRPACKCTPTCRSATSATEQTVLGSYANYSGRGGTGDTNLGCSYWLRKSNGCPFDPDIIATVGMTFPTAPASFLRPIQHAADFARPGILGRDLERAGRPKLRPGDDFLRRRRTAIVRQDVQGTLHSARPAIHLSVGGRLCRQRTGHLQRRPILAISSPTPTSISSGWKARSSNRNTCVSPSPWSANTASSSRSC